MQVFKLTVTEEKQGGILRIEALFVRRQDAVDTFHTTYSKVDLAKAKVKHTIEPVEVLEQETHL